MGEFTPIETQEQFDSMIGERLKREGDKIRKEYEGFLSPDEVTKKYEGYLSPDEAAKKDAQIKGYESHSVKTRIAHEMGLSYESIDFLKGEDEESIRKSAETLKALVGNRQAPPLASHDEPIGNSVDASLRNMIKNL